MPRPPHSSRHIWKRLLIVCSACSLILLFSSSCTSLFGPNLHAERTIFNGSRIELPTTEKNGCLIVEVQINGTGPYRLVVDTGAAGICLSEAVAKKAKLKASPPGDVFVQGIYSTTACGVAQIDSLTSGGFRLEQLKAVIVSDRNWSADEWCDGVLGIEPLRDVILEMDFAKKLVTMAKHGESNFANAPFCDFRWSGGVPEVEIVIGGRKLWAGFDTGNTSPLVIPSFDNLPLLYPKKKHMYHSVGIGQRMRLEELSQLAGEAKLGTITFRNPPLETSPACYIGVGVVQRLKIAVDQKQRRIYFLNTPPVVAWDKEIPTNIAKEAFGAYYRVDDAVLSLLEIVKDSPCARSGLRDFDDIVTVNGQPAATSEAFSAAIAKGELSEPLQLQIKRAEKEALIPLTLVPAMTTPEQIATVIANCNHAIAASYEDPEAYSLRARAKLALNDFDGAYTDLEIAHRRRMFRRAFGPKMTEDTELLTKLIVEHSGAFTYRFVFGASSRNDDASVWIDSTLGNSSAEMSGLRKLDRIRTINGKPAASQFALEYGFSVLKLPPGPVTLEVQRCLVGDEVKQFTLTVVSGAATPDDLRTIIANYDHIIAVFPDDAATYRQRATAKRAGKDYVGACVDFNLAARHENDPKKSTADTKAADEMHVLAAKAAKH